MVVVLGNAECRSFACRLCLIRLECLVTKKLLDFSIHGQFELLFVDDVELCQYWYVPCYPLSIYLIL